MIYIITLIYYIIYIVYDIIQEQRKKLIFAKIFFYNAHLETHDNYCSFIYKIYFTKRMASNNKLIFKPSKILLYTSSYS